MKSWSALPNLKGTVNVKRECKHECERLIPEVKARSTVHSVGSGALYPELCLGCHSSCTMRYTSGRPIASAISIAQGPIVVGQLLKDHSESE